MWQELSTKTTQYLLEEFVSVVLHLLLDTLPVFFGSFSRFQLILELHDLHLGNQVKKKSYETDSTAL